MKNLSIKLKLILLFIVVKIIPLLLIAFIAYEGAIKLETYIQKSTRYQFNQNKEIILNTANASIEDSVKNLDKKSQDAIERLSFEVAKKIADFLYERDKDVLFLSKININQKVLQSFFNSKKRDIITHEEYKYNDNTNKWESTKKPEKIIRDKIRADLKDNEKEFNFTDPLKLNKKTIPIYKEISYFNLEGKEIFKVSKIDSNLLDISKKSNTYVNSENYFEKIKSLKKGEIYVSDVIGEYVPSKVIGTFSKEKAKKAKIEFEPQNYAYAGKENPVGKRFEGIVRFVTPVFKNDTKVAYISLALDHEHIMQFTDTLNPTSKEPLQNISDASVGNYAFMWDYEGRNISHPRDYFIMGFNKKTGKREMPWLSLDLANKYKNSNKEINEFLKDYPKFDEQSLNKKPNISQLLTKGNIGLDCRYLNFAPQCQGWMQLTKNGGYGSFIIYWSKVWKLNSAATIPYYTGKYRDSKRGFGFVTIGANVNEFHLAANETKRNVNRILKEQTTHMEEIVEDNKLEIKEYIKSLVNELSIVTFVMIIIVIAIAIWVSNYISSKIEKLLLGTKKFANEEFDYEIKVESNDEIGNLENSFNFMAKKIKALIKEQKELNEQLEEKVYTKTKELMQINENLEKQIEQRTENLKKTLAKAQKADEAKSVFLANMSHEIRTPLNAILGFSELLSDNKSLDIQSKKQAETVHSSANSLLTIINDILDISKIESGNFEVSMESTDLYFISEHVVELFSKRALEKNIKLVFNIDPQIPLCLKTDGVRIRQVLSNFLSNAIKFTQSHGTVEINIQLLETKDNRSNLRFEVLDNGIGIPKDKIENIFQAFMQIDNKTNRKFEGTGLGLSICSHIIECFNSKINVESEVGKGTKFWFNIDFEICQNSFFDNKNYLDHLKYKIDDNNSLLYHYAKRYLNIFGEVNTINVEENIIIYSYTNSDDLQRVREKYKNNPILILLECERDASKFTLRGDEFFVSLPFYPSKINDAIRELLRKNNKNVPEEIVEQKDKFEAKILVAEDNLANQELISFILESLGVEFVIESNGKSAYESYQKNDFDLVLMDINMPIMDGVEALNKIREYEKEKALKQTPIIALTANAIKGDKEKFLNLGMNDYLSKPVNTNELTNVFEKFLGVDSFDIIDDKETIKIENKPNKKVENYGIELKKVVSKLGVNEKIANMVISKFKVEIIKDIEELKMFIDNEDVENIVSKAHYIKNSCLNVSLESVCEILQELENKELLKEDRLEKYKKIEELLGL